MKKTDNRPNTACHLLLGRPWQYDRKVILFIEEERKEHAYLFEGWCEDWANDRQS